MLDASAAKRYCRLILSLCALESPQVETEAVHRDGAVQTDM